MEIYYSVLLFALLSTVVAFNVPNDLTKLHNDSSSLSIVKSSELRVKKGDCDEEKPLCLISGGKCKRENDKIQCVCKDNAVYEDGIGCRVKDISCEEQHPLCKKTGGSCVTKDNYFQCICSERNGYSKEKGCLVPSPPKSLRCSEKTNTSLSLMWNRPEFPNGPKLDYILICKRLLGDDVPEVHTIPSTSDQETVSFVIRDLLPYTFYSIELSARNPAGQSHSVKVINQTEIGVPHPPTDLVVSNVTNTSLLIAWSEPKPSTGPIRWYSLRWNSSREAGSRTTRRRNYLVTRLLPYLNYTFSVSALTDAGQGGWSESLLIQTDIGVPSPPRNLRCIQKTNTSLNLMWNRPEFPNGPSLDYILTYKIQLGDDIPKVKRISASSKEEIVRFVIQDLLPYTNYSIQVSASNPAGQSHSVKVINQTNVGDLISQEDSDEHIFISYHLGKNRTLTKDSRFNFHFGRKRNSNRTVMEILLRLESEPVDVSNGRKCSQITCDNGGICVLINGKALCNCTEKYTGDYCEKDKCSFVTCKNGGKCEIKNGRAACVCGDSYTGDYCETDKCSLIRCHNGGKCVIRRDKAICDCDEKYIGQFCELDKCSLIRCLNDGKCEIKNEKAVCICTKNFTGDFCERGIDSLTKKMIVQ